MVPVLSPQQEVERQLPGSQQPSLAGYLARRPHCRASCRSFANQNLCIAGEMTPFLAIFLTIISHQRRTFKKVLRKEVLLMESNTIFVRLPQQQMSRYLENLRVPSFPRLLVDSMYQ